MGKKKTGVYLSKVGRELKSQISHTSHPPELNCCGQLEVFETNCTPVDVEMLRYCVSQKVLVTDQKRCVFRELLGKCKERASEQASE